MIEYKLFAIPAMSEDWWPFPAKRVPEPKDFDRLAIRIDGIVYNRWSEEFGKAFMWARLND